LSDKIEEIDLRKQRETQIVQVSPRSISFLDSEIDAEQAVTDEYPEKVYEFNKWYIKTYM
jgi:hypothetical protein